MNNNFSNYQKVIYIKYSELTLKKKNRMDFVRKLHNNIVFALKEFNVQVIYHYDYCEVINFKNDDLEKICEILKLIPGINSFSIAYILEKDLNKLVDFCLLLSQYNIENHNIKTFRITSHRQDKNFISSNEIINSIATKILKNTDLKVNLENYDWNLQVEIKNNCIVVYDLSTNGTFGLPVGSSGRALVLLSGGIDSPVAARLLMNRGLSVDFLTFITPPHTSDMALEKVKMLIRKITLNNKLCNSKLFVCNFTNLQNELAHTQKESYRITLMRRRFIKIAKEIAIQKNCGAIATGESLGQVASQTIESMQVINESAQNFLILRPLLAMDKNEIIGYAKKYQTYEISILPYSDSCSLFAPKKPVTQPKLETAIELESKILLLDELTESTIKIHTKEESFLN
ncbi:MAG: tRNA 4-thiouridine(8) synthase ThiI [Ureaplasma sp.]|nr:tRNA 4-thiouridine(8) synthase ThiI [Ureaplasma sp.]